MQQFTVHASAPFITASMSPSRSLSFLTLRFGRLHPSQTQLLSVLLPTHSRTLSENTQLLHNHNAPSRPPLANCAREANQKMELTTMEPVGQSGRHYLIERIIQERGLSHRVYLARYMSLRLCNRQYNMLTSCNTALETRNSF